MEFSKHNWATISETIWRHTLVLYREQSKNVFERRTSTGRGLFSFLGSGFAKNLGQIVSIRVETRSNTNVVNSSILKGESWFPIELRRSKSISSKYIKSFTT